MALPPGKPRKFPLLGAADHTTFILACSIVFCMSVSFGTYLAFSTSYSLHPVRYLSTDNHHTRSTTSRKQLEVTETGNSRELDEHGDPCHGRRVYMYQLPPKFNSDVLERCNKMVPWLSFCDHFTNFGFGKSLNVSSWYATDPYMLEVIFHERMKRYKCLATSPSSADVFFIPYYAGLDALRFLYGADNPRRYEHGTQLVELLEHNFSLSWRANLGHDHFMVTGRTAWDFASHRGKSPWGTGLRLLKQLENVTTLVMERRPWVSQEQAIPYPTSYHPSSELELQEWIEKVGASPRNKLVSFIGAARPQQRGSIRGILLEQCMSSATGACQVVNCSHLRCSHNPLPISEKLLSSVFCLQPSGDTHTRRSTFDSIICGCIPVFFHVNSAYTQYTWHLPDERESYSVFIPEKSVRDGLSVEEFLRRNVSLERTRELQRNVRELIPKLVYVHPENGSSGDAFNVAITEMIKRKITLLKQIN